MKDAENEWLSTQEAARRLGITTRTLYRFVDEGELPAYGLPDGAGVPTKEQRHRRLHPSVTSRTWHPVQPVPAPKGQRRSRQRVTAVGRTQLLVGEEARVIAAYKSGATIDEIADRYGVSKRPIRRILQAADIRPRTRGWRSRYTPATERKIATAYAAGATLAELATQFGGSQRSIRRACVNHGVPIRPTGRRHSTA
jgi:excisionase family DNA binding protein